MPLRKPLDRINEEDLGGLVGASSEGLTLEFKRDSPALGSDAEKREFLADVTSFANAAGGDIVYGIDAPQGQAEDVCPLGVDDLDALQLRVQQILDGNPPTAR